MRLLFLIFSFIFLFAACASEPPTLEYSLARTAYYSARTAQASRYAPAYWQKAEEDFLLAEQLYKKGEYQEAQEKFHASRELCEKAENVSRVKRFSKGDELP